MAERSDQLQRFVDAAFAAFDRHSREIQARRSVLQIFSRLETPGERRRGEGSQLPVCSHLSTALAIETGSDHLQRMIARFQAIEPLLIWRRREDSSGTSSENFEEGHANAMIVGPGGLEERSDAWIGVTLMAPGVRYPDHGHAPEEVYLVLSQGEFQHGTSEWFSPGIGGSFYNPPGIKHAMRSAETPLFAFWALLPDQTHEPISAARGSTDR
ncbi:dimethylsulfoniopropionate lyase [Rhizobium jaguaris]|uniref:Transcriptional regulator n=1 Tax=Rhizobium jaguaris TaxID=1312183 RepID=A0A387G0D7_9HYPH|nr:dimethylsulfoniopropionate lyase [Rhizobium jaguaris]AYG61834.1 transcriptional regulator [Rhizobium jaguaris]